MPKNSTETNVHLVTTDGLELRVERDAGYAALELGGVEGGTAIFISADVLPFLIGLLKNAQHRLAGPRNCRPDVVGEVEIPLADPLAITRV